MDLESLKAQASEEAARVLMDRLGFVPDEESDEYQDEYRRQFALIKARPESARPAVRVVELPPLRGGGPDARYAETVRLERLREIEKPEMRAWLARSWTSGKAWLETRDLPAPAFRRRVEAQYGDYLRQRETQAGAEAAERHEKARAAAAIAAKVKAAGITPQGLIELVDASERTKPAASRAKLAELHAGDRRLRVFETADPATLVVIESGEDGRSEYGIERDEGLVADLKLWGQFAPR